MTKIVIIKNKDNIVGFEISGHSGYASSGSDIVCAAISSITGSATLGIVEVLKIKANVVKNSKKALLKLNLPSNLNENEMKNAQLILKTMVLSLEDALKGYKKFYTMEVENEIY